MTSRVPCHCQRAGVFVMRWINTHLINGNVERGIFEAKIAYVVHAPFDIWMFRLLVVASVPVFWRGQLSE